MARDFEDHCWKDVIPADVLERHRVYTREVFVGPAPALIAIDLYESVYRGGNKPLAEATKVHYASCGENAWNAIEPTKMLFAAARAAGIPIFYSTTDTRPESQPGPVTVSAVKRPSKAPRDPAMYAIRPEFKPQPGDVVILKQRASAFFGTPLVAQLKEAGVKSVIMCGESTSGCVRASAVEAFSWGFHVTVVEECCFDRSDISHKVNLFDMHHKYCDVMHVDDVVMHLDAMARARSADAAVPA
jgi:maleamate amidohydrolase